MRSRGGGGLGIPGLESMAAKLALGMVAGSVLYLLTHNALGGLLLLLPGFIGSFLWQPFTYGFIEVSPMGILFSALIIWSSGGFLESVWGPTRMLLVTVGTTALAGFITSLLALVSPAVAAYPHTGGSVMATIIWVAYGLLIGRGQTNFWGIPLSGNAFAGIGAGFVVLWVLTTGGGPVQGLLARLPDVLGLLLIFGYVKGGSPRGLWLHLQHWRLQRQLKSRSRHLNVVSSERRDDRFIN